MFNRIHILKTSKNIQSVIMSTTPCDRNSTENGCSISWNNANDSCNGMHTEKFGARAIAVFITFSSSKERVSKFLMTPEKNMLLQNVILCAERV